MVEFYLDPILLLINTHRYNQSHHEEALRLFKEALRLTNEHKLQVVSKDKATIHYNCARAAIRMHRHLLAVEHCTFAIDLDSGFFKAWKLRGESRHKLHDFKDAVNDLERALKLSPADEKVFSMLEESRRARDMDHYTLFGVPAASSVRSSSAKRENFNHVAHFQRHFVVTSTYLYRSNTK